jgi:hypothetical protein
MSRFDYDVARTLRVADTPFHGLLMAAMLKSDTHNGALLRAVFPDVWDDVPVQLVVTEVRPGDPGLRPVCPRCGQPWTETACGVVHQVIGADPRLHWFT